MDDTITVYDLDNFEEVFKFNPFDLPDINYNDLSDPGMKKRVDEAIANDQLVSVCGEGSEAYVIIGWAQVNVWHRCIADIDITIVKA